MLFQDAKLITILLTAMLWIPVGCAQVSTSSSGENPGVADTASSAVDIGSEVGGIAACGVMDAVSCETFKATNAQRIANGLQALQFCTACFDLAVAHSQDMETNGYFSVNGQTETLSQLAASYGLTLAVAGDVAETNLGSAAVTQWMSTPADASNILNPAFQSFAVGTYDRFSTQVFYSGVGQ